MKIKPILFSGDMVRALLDDRKSVTRRVVKPQPADTDCEHEMVTYDQMLPEFYKGDYSCVCRKCGYGTQPNGESVFQPPYCPNDIMYVRETFAKISDWTTVDPDVGMFDGYIYKADWMDGAEHPKWRPSIHMPREAARIFLRVKGVQVKRLQDITVSGIRAEGIAFDTEQFVSSWRKFIDLWNSTIKPTELEVYGYAANPWVWAIEFERISKEEAEKHDK